MKHPMQTVERAPDGVVRFRQNKLIRHLVDAYPGGLNALEANGQSGKEDWEQLVQLIGYSVSAFGSLDFIGDEAAEKADRRAAKLAKPEPLGRFVVTWGSGYVTKIRFPSRAPKTSPDPSKALRWMTREDAVDLCKGWPGLYVEELPE